MSEVLLEVYLFVVIFSFLLWLTTPEKAEAVIKEEVNLVEIIDDSQNLIQEDKEFFSEVNEFGESVFISQEKVYSAIKNLTLRDARKIAKRLSIKQKIGTKTRNKRELIENILENLEADHRKVIEALEEIAII
jgi:HEPN domain-containing protein